jgi:hypothetical protein
MGRVMRVRRISDNAEIDVSVNSVGQLQTTATKTLLSEWLASGTGRVVTWINQSFPDASVGAVGTNVWPSTSNVANSTVADQPEITRALPFPTFKGDADSISIPGVLFKRLVQDFELKGVFTLRM